MQWLYQKRDRRSQTKYNTSIPNILKHSLRAGFATTVAIAGVPEHMIIKQTGHKKSGTIKRYIRLDNMWTENAATKIIL